MSVVLLFIHRIPIWMWFTLFSIDPYFLTLEDEEQPESFSLFCIGLNKCGGSLLCEVEHGIVPKISSQHLCLSNAKWVKLISCSTNKFLKKLSNKIVPFSIVRFTKTAFQMLDLVIRVHRCQETIACVSRDCTLWK